MYIINWWKELSGEVIISGSKNAALPLIAASLLVRWKVKLNNTPLIWDVLTFVDILKGIWVKTSFDKNILSLDTTYLSLEDLNVDMIKKIRASILLLSPLVHYFWELKIPFPWGCNIWKRPIDAHLNWLKDIWYTYFFDGDYIHIKWKPNTWDIEINAWFWVTSTENLIVANVLRKWTTTIKMSAIEPHVMNLIDFLRKAWANIHIRYNHEIIINWVEELKKDIEIDVVSDYIESGTFMILWALASKEYIDIKNARYKDLCSFIYKLKESWVRIDYLWEDIVRVYRSNNLKNVSIQTNIFPWFPTDLQSPFAILMTQADWIWKIHEVLFEWRLNFLVELEKMWAHTAILNPHEAMIFWKRTLKWETVTSWDLRAWAAMVIAWIIATWTTKVTKIEYIERWYEDFLSKLKCLWADINKV